MAYGKIVADQIQHSSEGTVGTQYVVSGSAKFICNWNGETSTTVNDSFNQSSQTDHGTGDHTHTFTNNFANVFYASSGNGYYQASVADTAHAQWTLKDASATGLADYKLTGSMRGEIVYINANVHRTNYDYPGNWGTIHGDLA